MALCDNFNNENVTLPKVECSKRGRPELELTPAELQLVYELAKMHRPLSYIAARIRDGISVDTLQKHYAKELALAHGETNGKVIDALLDKALSGNVPAMIHWTSKNPTMKWCDKQDDQSGGLSVPVSGLKLVFEEPKQMRDKVPTDD